MSATQMSGGDVAAERANVVRDVVKLVIALRSGPSTMAELAESTGLHWRKVYRLIADMRAAGAPLRETMPVVEHRGTRPTAYALSVSGLREWLG